MITKQDIKDFLKSINVKQTDTVLIHTSFKSIGGVENGCDGFLDGFIEYLTDGLFIVPTHTWANVNRDNPVFDVKTTIPCIGAVPTTAAFRKDMVRSLHPTHSIAVHGKRAKEYVLGEENSQTPCPKNGAWDRLYQENAIVLLIGVTLNRNTYMHTFDESFNLPNRFDKPFDVTAIDSDGNKYTHIFYPHLGTGSEFFINYRPALEKTGALTYAKLGDATVEVFDVQKGTKTISHILNKATYDVCEDFKPIPEEYYNDL
jgi:aminoglycoside 3-N-acetyltransferase